MDELRLLEHPILGRLPAVETVQFSCDGRELVGRVGEPIVAALFANNIRVFRTMPKTGRPRGGFCFAGRCSDCQMIVDGVPNVMACITPLRAGMQIETQDGVGRWSDES